MIDANGIESFLFGMLQKVNKTYYLELKDGRKLWIDHSPPNDGEVECNQMDMQQRTDEFMTDLYWVSDKLEKEKNQIKEVFAQTRHKHFHNFLIIPENNKNK